MKNNDIEESTVTKRDSQNFTVGQKVIAVKDITCEADDCGPEMIFATKGEILVIREIDGFDLYIPYGVLHENCKVDDVVFWVASDEIKVVGATS